MSHVKEGYPRAVFNNIFFNFGALGGITPPPPELGQSDGNLFWSPDAQKKAATFFDRYRKSSAFEQSKATYAPGSTSHSLAVDPKLQRVTPSWPEEIDLRLTKGSPAVNAGATVPAEWPDSRRPDDSGKPDIGAFPSGSTPLFVGRNAAKQGQ
jgi:hypothetical protein